MPTAKPPDTGNGKEIPILPRRDAVKIKGNLLYNESAQTWNIIRLRNDILHEFPELRDKRTIFTYKLVIPRTPQAIKKHLEEAAKSPHLMPIFLSFAKVKKENQ